MPQHLTEHMQDTIDNIHAQRRFSVFEIRNQSGPDLSQFTKLPLCQTAGLSALANKRSDVLRTLDECGLHDFGYGTWRQAQFPIGNTQPILPLKAVTVNEYSRSGMKM